MILKCSLWEKRKKQARQRRFERNPGSAVLTLMQAAVKIIFPFAGRMANHQ
jgi:hypothetical protein